jgi:DNA-binding SARP family transcriptional activator
MSEVRANLFGQFRVQVDGRAPVGLDSGKSQELLSYLLLSRDRPHSREKLATLLWEEQTPSRSRKYLRQALWQLQQALNGHRATVDRVLLVEPEWVKLNPAAAVVCDVAAFEDACAGAQGRPGHVLDVDQAEALRRAADLYRGNLLEGWYQDWCIYERERLQSMHLGLLGKLTAFHEARGEFEAAIAAANQILRYDRAHERTHQCLMRLHYLAGDRAAALRQYQRCAATLAAELDVRPSRRTLALHEEIRADALVADPLTAGDAEETGAAPEETASLPAVLDRLRRVQATLGDVHRQLGSDIRAIERALGDGDLSGAAPG